jgi:uncharacterized protein YegL
MADNNNTSKKTGITILLDRSGSMQGMEGAVIEGINAFLKQQRDLPYPAELNMVRFDSGGYAPGGSSRIEEFRGFKDIKEVHDLQPFEFQPAGGTPLLDAFGYVITKLDSAIQERGFDKIIVVVYTDGGENTSTQYKKTKIKDMVTKRQNTDKWAFIFMGAGIDAYGDASELGIHVNNTVATNKSAKGYLDSSWAASASVGLMRGGMAMNSALNSMTDTYNAFDAAAKPEDVKLSVDVDVSVNNTTPPTGKGSNK